MMNLTMREKYTATIGLEVHGQLLTQSKMFAPETTAYGNLPNTNISTLTLAHPGTLPTINKKAIEYAIKMGIACHSTITRTNVFARKNYFYPDLPKGYQITQDKTPICREGYITINTNDGQERHIELLRIHLEEDAGKSIHGAIANETLIDFNRAGIPLIEIVTKPVINTSEEAYKLLTEIRKLVRYLDICDGNMEEGALRCDANVSVKRKDAQALGEKVEVKNMNSIRNVQLAIEHEIERQIKVIEEGGKVVAETRSYDATTGKTHSQRTKETLNDYRYFPEPDLSPLILSEAWIAQIRQTMPSLPRELFKKFIHVYQLPAYDASVLTDDKATALFFEKLCQLTPHYKAASNWMMGPIKSYLNELAVPMHQFPLTPTTLANLIALVEEKRISFSAASQRLYPALLKHPEKTPLELVETLQLRQESDASTIQGLIDEVLAAYPHKVADYKKGKKGLMGMFMGEIMKKSKGKVEPTLTRALLAQKLMDA